MLDTSFGFDFDIDREAVEDPVDDIDIMKLSNKIIDDNLEIYKELA